MSEFAAKAIPTHEATNQPPQLPSLNLFEADIALVEAVRRSGAAGAEAHLNKSGQLAG
jgi:putative acyl-CoA dehydrogenase